MGWEWILLQQNCTGCGICVDVCPHDVLSQTLSMAYPEPDNCQCVGCMVCLEECPFGAIEVQPLGRPMSQ